MRCNNCGFDNGVNSQFCMKCGIPLINNGGTPTQQVAQENVNSNEKNKNNKKIIFIIIAIMAIAGIIVFIFTNHKISDDKKDEIIAYNPNTIILVKKNGLYGYIDLKGKELISPKYTSANEFVDGYAVVIIDNYDGSDCNDSYRKIYKVIDKNDNTMAISCSNPLYSSKYKVWLSYDKSLYGSLFDSKFKKMTNGSDHIYYLSNSMGKYYKFETYDSENKKYSYGLINYKGNKTYVESSNKNNNNYIYYSEHEISTLLSDYCLIRKNDDNNKETSAIVNCDTGKIVYGYTDYHIVSNGNNIFSISDNPYRYIYIANDKIIEARGIYAITKNYSEKDDEYLRMVNDNDETKYIRIKDNAIVDTLPSVSKDINTDIDSNEILYGYKIKRNSGKYGLLKDDDVILNYEYDDIYFVNPILYKYIKDKKKQELVILKKDNKTSLMDLSSKKILFEFAASTVTSYDDNTFLKTNKTSDSKIQIYNVLSGKSILIDYNYKTKIQFYDSYMTETLDDKVTYYNIDLENIYDGEA